MFEISHSPPVTIKTVRRILSLAGVQEGNDLSDCFVGSALVLLRTANVKRLDSLLRKIHVRAAKLTACVRGFLLRRKMTFVRKEKEKKKRQYLGAINRITDLQKLQALSLAEQARIADLIAKKKKNGRRTSGSVDLDDYDSVVGNWSSQDRHDTALRAIGLYSAEAYKNVPNLLIPKEQIILFTKDLHRYINILPTLTTIVKLHTPVKVPNTLEVNELPNDERVTAEHVRSRFINANFVRGFEGNPRSYIGTQGPTAQTAPAFWQMVWDYNVRGIVMVTGIIEEGKEKCFRYWPSKMYNYAEDVGQEYYGDIQVYVLCGRKRHEHVVTELGLHYQGETRCVTHYWFTGWPDHGVPSSPHGLMELRTDVSQIIEYGKVPLVVHCSAGIGRTGTFIAIDSGLRMLNSTSHVDLIALLRMLREDRGGMIQTAMQFKLVYDALTSYCERKAIGLTSNGDGSGGGKTVENISANEIINDQASQALLSLVANEFDENNEDEGVFKNLPYIMVMFDHEQAVEKEVYEITHRQRKLRVSKGKRKDAERQTVVAQLNAIGMCIVIVTHHSCCIHSFSDLIFIIFITEENICPFSFLLIKGLTL